MVLVFEGADRVGKTTLARHYARATGWPIVKVRWDLRDAEAETVAFAKMTLGLLLATNPDVILDRSFLSMWAYASGPDYMEPLLQAVGDLPDLRLIVLTASPDALRVRHRERPDAYFTEAQALDANGWFARLPDALPAGVRTLRLDTGVHTVEQCCAAIDAFLQLSSGPPATGSARFVERRIPVGEIPVDVSFPVR
jgi:hypothetical protein